VNRLLWLLVAAALVGAAYFEVRFPDHRTSLFFATAAIVAIAAPSLIATVKWLEWRRGLALLVTLASLSYVIEAIGLMTGWPYGTFEYGSRMGPKIGSTVPLLLPGGFVPLVLGAIYVACRTRFSDRKRWTAFGLLALVSFDMILDPGAVAMGYWKYLEGGLYFEVPAVNFFGWLLSGTIALTLSRAWLAQTCARECNPPDLLSFSAFMTLAYWAGISLWLSLWLPALLGAAVLTMLLLGHKGTR
jgi:putative membrane protein